VSDREVHRCESDGYGTALVDTRPWPESCDIAAGRCACVPGPVCNGTTATTCTTSGTYAAGGTDCALSNLTCIDGVCAASIFTEDFEAGDYSRWTRGDAVLQRTVDSTVAANGSGQSLMQEGGGAAADDGLYREFTAARPKSIALWMRARDASSFNRVNTTFSGVEGDFYVEIARQRLTNGSMWQGAQNGQWYHIELRNFDWDAHTYDFYVDGVLVQAGASTNNASSLRRMTLVAGSVDATTRGWWDEIVVR
jgi:hypothetical protein